MTLRVLLVEDDQDLAILMSDWLQFESCTVDLVHDGFCALEQITFEPYDLILLDGNLPGLSGFEVCRKYRAQGGRTPVIILSGEDDVQSLGAEAGADCCICKPVDFLTLRKQVKELTNKRG
jgi:DNA-binding response OmpR family regulator